MTDKQFKFRVKLGNFEFEVEGDRGFVEKTMTRYEGRFLPRFQQLMDSVQHPVPVGHPTGEETAQVSGSATTNTPEKSEARPVDKSHGQKKDKSRRSRSKKRPRNNSSTWVKPAPALPKDQEITYAPYMPDAIEKVDSHRHGAESKKSGNYDVLREIFGKINPRTHNEKTLAIAYFLQDHNGYPDFTSNNIKTCYEAVGADPAGNISQVLNHASRTGFLTKSQRGRQVRYSLTSKGKHFVERGLDSGD